MSSDVWQYTHLPFAEMIYIYIYVFSITMSRLDMFKGNLSFVELFSHEA